MRFLWAEGRGRVALPGKFITIAFHVPGTWHSSAACQHICTWIAGERVAVYMEIFTFTYICMHWKCSQKTKKKENKKWRRDTKVGGDGGVFRSKAALYENGNGMGKKLGKSGRVTTHRWQSICRMPKVIRFESEIQNYSLTGTERAMPERFLKRSIFNLKTSRDPWESLVGKIASGPYLAHKRNENKIVWQLPAKRQNGKRCSAIASKLHISISNERQLAEKLLPMVAKKSAPNWKVQKVLEKLKKKTWKNSEQIHKKLVNSPYPKEAQKKAT